MADINLLPQHNQEDRSSSRVAVIGRKVGIIASIVLLIGIVIYAGVYGFFYLNKNLSTTSTTTLETQIRGQESTEQKIVLLRDRAGKASKILGSPSADDEIATFLGFNGKLPEGVVLKETRFLPNEFYISIQTDESDQITEFIRLIKAGNKFSQIEAVSIDFSAKDRYLSAFRLVNTPL